MTTNQQAPRFRIGDRVKLTPLGRSKGLLRRSTDTGTVRGFGRQPLMVRVQRDGCKAAETWHYAFWELRP